MIGLGALLSAGAQGAEFQFGALLQWGVAGNGDYEIAVGNNPAAPDATASLANHWVSNVERLIQVEYLKGTNTATVRVYDGATATGGSTQVSFQPTGGGTVAADAIWTLPASAFFVTAQGVGSGGPIFGSSASLSNITLSGVSGAINVIQPIQQTTLTAARGFLGGTSTVAQTGDIVFQADATGSWRLQGTLRLTLSTTIGVDSNDLQLGISGAAVEAVPEPGTVGLVSIGFLVMAGVARRRKCGGNLVLHGRAH